MPYLEIGDASVYHEVHGVGDPVVLLHGGFCSIETMRVRSPTWQAGLPCTRRNGGDTAARPTTAGRSGTRE